MAARVHIDVGDVHAEDPVATGVWDEARWDHNAARWAGTIPNWTEVSCRVREVAIDRGRSGILEIFEAGRATIEVANDDGWATWSTTAPAPVTAGSWIRVRADQTPLFTGIVRRITDTYRPDERPGATLVCVDPLARLAQVELPARVPTGAGDTAAERIGRILDEVSWPDELRALEGGGPELTASVLDGPMADQAQQAAVTAGGHLWAATDGTITYRSAGWLRTASRSTTVQALISNVPAPAWHDNLLTHGQATASSVQGWSLNLGTAEVITGGVPDEGTTWIRFSHSIASGQFLSAGQRPVTAGQTYTFMASQRRQRAGQIVRLVCRWLDPAGALVTTSQHDLTVANYGWYRNAMVTVAPAGATAVELRLTYPGMAAGEYGGLDRVGWFPGEVPVSEWTDPDTPAPGPQMCATGMDVNGPDVERVLNVVTYAGRDDALPDDEPVEVTRAHTDSRRRFGPQTWTVTDLFTTDARQLGVLADRVLGMRADPAPWLESIELSPIADPAASDLCRTVEFGDLLQVDYQDRLGWGWSFPVHVHGIAHRVRPSGENNQAAEWTLTLVLDDASPWLEQVAWDFAAWDIDTWDTRPQEAPAWA